MIRSRDINDVTIKTTVFYITLMLSMLGKNFQDMIFNLKYFFSTFPLKIGFDISCKLFPIQFA